jgi:1,4-dihydroxy-2-naphthoyl-CoA synthase
MTTHNPTISDAKKLCVRDGKAGVIIFHFNGDGSFGFASYGRDRKRCRLMGRIADQIFDRIEQGDIQTQETIDPCPT